jgi:hypothetical protein
MECCAAARFKETKNVEDYVLHAVVIDLTGAYMILARRKDRRERLGVGRLCFLWKEHLPSQMQ